MARLSDYIDDEGEGDQLEPASPERTSPKNEMEFRNLGSSIEADDAGSSNDREEDWRQSALTELSRIGDAVRQGRSFSVGEIERIAAGIVESLQKHDRLLVQVLAGDNASLIESNLVNVAILGTKIGMGLGYRREELIKIAMAGLLHDVGMNLLPEDMVHKTGKYDQEERRILRVHPEKGYETLRQLGSKYEWLAQVALQEHERWHGKGYPQGLSRDQIHPYAQIISIADRFDAMLNSRPYRGRLLPHEAVRKFFVTEKSEFQPQYLKVLAEQFSMFPIGTQVRLSTGETGTVIQRNPRFPLRPVVQLMPSPKHVEGESPLVVDLSKNTLVHIMSVLGTTSSHDS